MSKKHLKIFGTYMFVIILLMIFLIGCGDPEEKCYSCDIAVNTQQGWSFYQDIACGEDERNAKINDGWLCNSVATNSSAVGNITGPGD